MFNFLFFSLIIVKFIKSNLSILVVVIKYDFLRKVIVIFSLYFISFFSVFGYINTYNLEGEKTDYFSLNNPEVKLETDLNYTKVNISYVLDNLTYSNIYDLVNCENKNNIFCSQFSFIDFLDIENSTFHGSLSFNISVENESKEIYLDLLKPNLNYNKTINRNNLMLNIKLNDNFSDIMNLEIFINNSLNKSINKSGLKKLNSNYYYITNLTFNKGTYNIKLKAEDLAGNYKEVCFDVEIEDFTPPEIILNFVEVGEKTLLINFKAIDDNKVFFYKVVQGSYKVSEDTNESSITKEVALTSLDDFYIYVEDENRNNKTLYYNYEDFSIVLKEDYGNKNEIELKTTADNCFLETLNNNYINESFKSNNDFYISFDDTSTGGKVIKGFCTKNKLKKYFTLSYFLDKDKPKEIELNATKTDDGFIILKWTESEDNESEIVYKLYRNNKKIYSGSKLKYEDRDVFYPNEYEYVVKVFDKADNFVVSNKINIVPKDVSAILFVDNTSYLVNTDEEIKIRIKTEKDATLYIEEYVNNTLMNKSKINLNENYYNLNYKPRLGKNKILLRVEDNSGNVKEEEIFITFIPEVLSKNEESKEDEIYLNKIEAAKINLSKNLISNNNLTNVEKNNLEKKSLLWKIFKFFLLIILLIFVLGFVFILFKNRDEYFNKKKGKGLPKFNFKNVSFNREIQKIQERRLRELKRKEEERKKKELKKKEKEKEKRLTEYSKEKLKDLKNRRNLKLDLQKKKVVKKKKNVLSFDFFSSIKRKKKDDLEGIVLEENSKEKKNEKVKQTVKNLDFLNSSYFEKARRGWDNPRDYIYKEEKKEKKNEEDEKKPNLESNSNNKEEVKNKKSDKKKRSIFSFLRKKRKGNGSKEVRDEESKKENKENSKSNEESKISEDSKKSNSDKVEDKKEKVDRKDIFKTSFENYLNKRKTKYSFYEKEKELEEEL